MVSAVITSLNPGIAEPNETDTRFPRRKYPLERAEQRVHTNFKSEQMEIQKSQCRQCKQYEQCKLGKVR